MSRVRSWEEAASVIPPCLEAVGLDLSGRKDLGSSEGGLLGSFSRRVEDDWDGLLSVGDLGPGIPL